MLVLQAQEAGGGGGTDTVLEPALLLASVEPLKEMRLQQHKPQKLQELHSGGKEGTSGDDADSATEGDDERSGAARWRQVRTRMRKLTHGMRTTRRAQTQRRRTGDGESCSGAILHKDFWLEALDEQHRYGFHLRAFHKAWKREMAGEGHVLAAGNSHDSSFFHWLDHGNGQQLELPECSQHDLRTTHVLYCSPEQRKRYEVCFQPREAPEDGDALAQYAATGQLVHTDERSKWIFVVDLHGRMYLGRKRKGRFHHSSFVAGAPILAAGKIVIKHGSILAIEPHSGHFKPRLQNLTALCSLLAARGVDVTRVAFLKPKKWACEWPFPPQPALELEDLAAASDTDYGADRSDTEELPMSILAPADEES